MPHQIDRDVLLAFGAQIVSIKRGDPIFNEGESPRYYHQVDSGEVRMFNVHPDGKIFTQGLFGPGQSFGEPPLFIDRPYPASTVCCADGALLRLPKHAFLHLLEEYPALERTMLKTLCERLYSKANRSKHIANGDPQDRILDWLREYKSCMEGQRIQIPYTRQEIANLTGLRVETVIRTIKTLESKDQVEIRGRKIFF